MVDALYWATYDYGVENAVKSLCTMIEYDKQPKPYVITVYDRFAVCDQFSSKKESGAKENLKILYPEYEPSEN